MTALKGLAGGAFTSFLSEYKALESSISDLRQLAFARKDLFWLWLFRRPKEMFDELRENQPIFQMPGYPAGGVGTVTIVTKYDDVLEILRNRNKDQVFSVRKYTEKMEPPRGPSILGMPDWRNNKKEEQEAQYLRELNLNSSPLSQAISIQDTNTETRRTAIKSRKQRIPQNGPWMEFSVVSSEITTSRPSLSI